MKNSKRNFLRLFGLSFLSILLSPYQLLYSATKKIINQNLSDEQKNIMFNEATERPYTSPLNHEKRSGFFTVRIVALSFFHQKQNLIVEQVGLLLQSHYQERLKLKLIIL